jgi:receptor protein-tyrosine kinase
MDDRAGLIERAAALLRDGKSVGDTPFREAIRAANSDPAVAVSPPPLSRHLELDRLRLAQTGIVMPWTTTARIVDEFRIAKRRIMFAWQLPDYPSAAERPPRVIMVTSSRPREGKTYCSINLALAFAAEENLVTVLIDSDAVRADAAKVLRIPGEPGFTEVLMGKVALEDVLIQTDLPNLVVLPPGAYGPHVPELLSGRAPNRVCAEIAKRYPEHVIIIDTAPCLASTDPAAVAAIASEVVFVIEAERTQQTEIESSVNLLSACQKISFLLNKSPVGSSEHFGAYSYYYRPGEAAARTRED